MDSESSEWVAPKKRHSRFTIKREITPASHLCKADLKRDPHAHKQARQFFSNIDVARFLDISSTWILENAAVIG